MADFKLNWNEILKTEIHLFGKSLNSQKKETFYAELSVLLQAGITLKEALLLISHEQPKENDKNLFMSVHDKLIRGTSFSMALKQTEQFSDYEYYSLQIGEETGALPKVTQDLSVFFKRRNEQKRNIISALSYPIVVMLTAFLAVFFMLKYVVPMFASLFKQHQTELPSLTKFVIHLSNIFDKYFVLVIIITIAIFIVLYKMRKKEWFRKWSSNIVLKIPYIGELTRKIYLSQYTQATGLLMNSKVPMIHSIRLTQKMIQFYPLQKALIQVEKDIISGENLSKSLLKHSVFDARMVSLIKVAEETNQNALMFDRLTSQYTEEVQYKSKMLSTVLEPIIIIFLGAMVAVILIAMYLPMFQLSSIIG